MLIKASVLNQGEAFYKVKDVQLHRFLEKEFYNNHY